MGQQWAVCVRGWAAGMAGGAFRWVQGAVDEGVGGLFLAGDGVGVDGVQDRDAVPGAGGCFLGWHAGGDPQGQGGVAQVVGAADERRGSQGRAARLRGPRARRDP
jgi:hypothetical protein